MKWFTHKKTEKVIDYSFIMSEGERALFDFYICKSKKYLEFGTGGSTIRASQISKATIISVESSVDWIETMRKNETFQKLQHSRIRLHPVDVGPTGEWGMPTDELQKDKFPNYSASVFKTEIIKGTDLVLVDGRFRVACVLSSIINLQSKQPIIMIHDFWNRKHYHDILEFVDVKGQADTLAVVKPKNEITIDKLTAAYEKFMYDPR